VGGGRGEAQAQARERERDRPARRLAASAVNKGVDAQVSLRFSLLSAIWLRKAASPSKSSSGVLPPRHAHAHHLVRGTACSWKGGCLSRTSGPVSAAWPGADGGAQPTCPHAPRGTQGESDVHTQMRRPEAARTAYTTRTHVFLLAAAASHCGSVSRAPAPCLLRLEL
jgi:hypothetical protein